MNDDEIREKLTGFASVWRRVSGENINLPAALVLMPGKNGNVSPYMR